MNERMANTNEWRAQSHDREAAYATRDLHDALAARVTQIDNARARSDGQMAMLVGIASLVSASVAAAVVRLAFG